MCICSLNCRHVKTFSGYISLSISDIEFCPPPCSLSPERTDSPVHQAHEAHVHGGGGAQPPERAGVRHRRQPRTVRAGKVQKQIVWVYFTLHGSRPPWKVLKST